MTWLLRYSRHDTTPVHGLAIEFVSGLAQTEPSASLSLTACLIGIGGCDWHGEEEESKLVVLSAGTVLLMMVAMMVIGWLKLWCGGYESCGVWCSSVLVVSSGCDGDQLSLWLFGFDLSVGE